MKTNIGLFLSLLLGSIVESNAILPSPPATADEVAAGIDNYKHVTPASLAQSGVLSVVGGGAISNYVFSVGEDVNVTNSTPYYVLAQVSLGSADASTGTRWLAQVDTNANGTFDYAAGELNLANVTNPALTNSVYTSIPPGGVIRGHVESGVFYNNVEYVFTYFTTNNSVTFSVTAGSANALGTGATINTANGRSLTNLLIPMGTNFAMVSPAGVDATAQTGSLSGWRTVQSAIDAASGSKSLGFFNSATMQQQGRVLLSPGTHLCTEAIELYNGVGLCGFGVNATTLILSPESGPQAIYLDGNNTIENLSFVMGTNNGGFAWLSPFLSKTNIVFRNCRLLGTFDFVHPESGGQQFTLDHCEMHSMFDRFLSYGIDDTNSELNIIRSTINYDPRGRTYAPNESNQTDACAWNTKIVDSQFYYESSVTNSVLGDAGYGFYHQQHGGSLTIINSFWDFQRITNTGAVYVRPSDLAHMAMTNGAQVFMQNAMWREPSGAIFSFSTANQLTSGSYTGNASGLTNVNLVNLQAVGAGSTVVPFGSPVALVFSATNVAVTLSRSGTYMLAGFVNVSTTVASGDMLTTRLRRTSGTPGDVAFSTATYATHANLAGSDLITPVALPVVKYTATAGDVITLMVGAVGSEFTATQASILAVRIGE